jgi:hypothetical protein
VAFVKKIDWASLWDQAKEWIRNPMNMALSVWVVAVAVSGAILFMVMTGMLNRALPTKPQRDTWFEVNNQILNALFTLMCLVQHPRRFYHLALLCRWRAGDMLQLRQAYCKDATCKPGERKHMAVVILLLHLNCFAQYALCGLNLGYRRPQRPVVGVAITVSVAISGTTTRPSRRRMTRSRAAAMTRSCSGRPPSTSSTASRQQQEEEAAGSSECNGRAGCLMCGTTSRWPTSPCSAAAA